MARDFDGSDDFIEIANPDIGIIGAYTVCCWVKYDSLGVDGNAIIAYGEDDDNEGWQLAFNNGGYVQQQQANSQRCLSVSTVSANTWVHLAARRLGSGVALLELIIDGVEDNSTNTDFPAIQASTVDFRIGKPMDGDVFAKALLNGQVAEVMYWSGVALSDDEIKSAMYGMIPRRDLLQLYMPLGHSSPEVDYSGNKFSGVITGGAVVADHAPVMLPFGSDLITPYTAAAVGELILTMDGGGITGGEITAQRVRTMLTELGGIAGGSADYSTVLAQQILELVMAGGGIVGGETVAQRLASLIDSGGGIAGGAATVIVQGLQTLILTMAGGAITGGEGIYNRVKELLSAGGGITGGDVVAARCRQLVASGGGVVGGDVILTRVLNTVASGGAVAAGDVTYLQHKILSILGGAIAGGSAGFTSNISGALAIYIFGLVTGTQRLIECSQSATDNIKNKQSATGYIENTQAPSKEEL